MTRQEIKDKMKANYEAMHQLDRDNIDLYRQLHTMSDDVEWYEEKEETHTKGRGKNKVTTTHVVGRRHWKETFIDEGTGEGIEIERSAVVKVDGIFQPQYHYSN